MRHPPLQEGNGRDPCPGRDRTRPCPPSPGLPTPRPPERTEPTGPPERIGLFGGTFDPPHLGHVAALRAVSRALSLDRLLLVVANDPWQKSSSRAVTPAEDRFAMAQALAEGIPGVEASRMEIDRGGPSYTVTTVEALRAEAVAATAKPPERVAMRTAAWLFAGPRRFAAAERVGRLGQRPLIRGGTIRRLPRPLAAWTRTRDLRPLAGESFRDWWERRG